MRLSCRLTVIAVLIALASPASAALIGVRQASVGSQPVNAAGWSQLSSGACDAFDPAPTHPLAFYPPPEPVPTLAGYLGSSSGWYCQNWIWPSSLPLPMGYEGVASVEFQIANSQGVVYQTSEYSLAEKSQFAFSAVNDFTVRFGDGTQSLPWIWLDTGGGNFVCLPGIQFQLYFKPEPGDEGPFWVSLVRVGHLFFKDVSYIENGDPGPVPVPEPASLLLLGVGAAVARSLRRRRSHT